MAVLVVGLSFVPDAFACTLDYGIANIVMPWTPVLETVEAECSVGEYAVDWIGVASLSAISVAAVLLIRYVKHRQKLFG